MSSGNIFVIYLGLLLFLTCTDSMRQKQDDSFSIKSIKEPNCFKCACMAPAFKEKHRPSILKIMGQKMYGVIESKSSSMQVHVAFRGSPPNSEEDMNKLCIAETFDLTSGVSVWESSGFNMSANVNLKNLSRISVYNIEQRFDPLGMSESHGMNYMHMTAPKYCAIAWTDYTSSILFTTCLWDGQTAWYVMSTQKVLSRKTTKTILKKVTALGFDPAKAYTTDYSKCP